MAFDEMIMLDVLKAVTRIETKLDMQNMEEEEEEEGCGPDLENESSETGAYLGGLEFEMPPFILE